MTEDKSKKPFVLVLMPFKNEFKNIYTDGIKVACEEAGCECERVDEQKFTKFILDQIYEQIAKADFLVAELSEPNINVYYEVGYAHSQGKNVILVAKEDKKIPFDLQNYQVLIYDGSIDKLKKKLIDRAKWAVEELKKKPEKAGTPQSEDNIDEIKRLLDEIDRFRELGGKEIIARKTDNIKRLIELDVKPLHLEKCNLSGAELVGFDLREANLHGANLKGALLQEANLQRAILKDAILEEANLQGADLQEANLQGANLHGANLQWVNLLRAKNITFEQLLEVKSLFDVKGLDPELEVELRKEKPLLFSPYLGY